MDFNLDPRNESYRKRIRDFVEQELLPLEQNPEAYDEHENIAADSLEQMRAKAKQQGLWCLQLPERLGGQGLDISGMAACYEEMNRSIFGPVVFNSAAPDDGNMTVLAKVGTEAQQERWLKPIVEGRVRSSFVMTEPPPGCGSDPGMMQTTATRKGDRWVIHGHKHFITGAAEASHFILIARTSEDTRKGLSAFLEIATDYVDNRESFGQPLAQREGVQWLLGEAAMEIQIGRLLTMHAAWKLDQGDFARKEVSMAKVSVADTLHKAVDTAIQLCGARGYSKDTPLEWIYRYARQARLVDGASEVHKMVFSRTLLAERTGFWHWGVEA